MYADMINVDISAFMALKCCGRCGRRVAVGESYAETLNCLILPDVVAAINVLESRMWRTWKME